MKTKLFPCCINQMKSISMFICLLAFNVSTPCSCSYHILWNWFLGEMEETREKDLETLETSYARIIAKSMLLPSLISPSKNLKFGGGNHSIMEEFENQDIYLIDLRGNLQHSRHHEMYESMLWKRCPSFQSQTTDESINAYFACYSSSLTSPTKERTRGLESAQRGYAGVTRWK